MKLLNNKNHFVNIFSNTIILLILAVFCALTLNFNIAPVSSNNNEAIYSGNKNSNKVCLMINVYWGTEFLDSILTTLKEYNTKTTFFVGGQWVEKYPEMLIKIYNDGHEIGNHGYFHRDHTKLNYNQNKEEIKACESLVFKTINIKPLLFAPPSGAYNKTTLQLCADLGYKTIMWSKDTIDWRDKDSNLVFERATSRVVGGDLILMHPTNHTAIALPRILEYYKTNNLVATTVSNTLK